MNAGQSAAAKSEAEEARALLQPRLAERAPEDRTSLSESAWVYVCLGRNADALRLAREAAESMPIEKDAILGINFLVGLAQIEAHTGQSEQAVKLLRQLLTMPAGEYISVARLKMTPSGTQSVTIPVFKNSFPNQNRRPFTDSELKRPTDVISDALPLGRLWDGEPNAVGNAVAQRNQITR